MSESIHNIKPGDYVKTSSGMKKIESIWGVGEGQRVAPPSQGGFGVVTTDGRRVSMWEARSYHKREEVEK